MDTRSLFFLCAMTLYGLLGTPTPDHFGMTQYVIGLGLILTIGITGARQSLSIQTSNPLWQSAAQTLLIFGLSAPLISAILSGHTPNSILRDLIPFLFMILPLFMLPTIKRNPNFLKITLYGGLFIGSTFGLRSILGSDPLFYLANMPTLLMSAIFCAGLALTLITKQTPTLKTLPTAAILLILSSLALWPIIITQQRASLGAFLLALLLIIILRLAQSPLRMLALLAIITGLATFFIWPEISTIATTFSSKNAQVGSNMRIEEWSAVWAEISTQPATLILGKGWGASFSSPAVADIRVYYTHSLLSSIMLKTGLIGLALTGIYLSTLLRFGLKNASPMLALALLFPLLIDIFLYASFKSLDFGILLLILAAQGTQASQGPKGKNNKTQDIFSL